jgi:hypothetical protein
MQQQKLYKWCLALLSVGLLASCARSNYPGRNPDPRSGGVYYPGPDGLPPGQAKKVYGHQSARVFAPGQRKKMRPPYGYRPPTVIIIADNLASVNRNGEMYYDNEYGYRYWRNCDSKYYLDSKYERDGYYSGERRKGKQKGKQRKHRQRDDDWDDD